MQIKITIRYQYTSTKMTNMKKTDNAKCFEDTEQLELIAPGGSVNYFISFGITLWQYLLKMPPLEPT